MNHRIAGWIAVPLLSFSSFPETAFAQNDMLDLGPCRLELNVTTSVDWLGPTGRGYDVFSSAESYETAAIEIRHSGEACQYSLTAAPASGSSTAELANGSNRLAFDLVTDTNGPSLISADYFGSEIGKIEGQFADGMAVQVVPLLVKIPSGQFARAGQYQGQVLLRLFSGEGMPALVAEAPLGVTTRVSSALEVRSPDFGSGQREIDIDLGDLSGPVERDISFEIRSNADVNVGFRSRNNGKLAHSHGAPGIAYLLDVRGMQVDPSAAAAVSFPFRPDGQSFDMPVKVSIPGVGDTRAAGQYEDTLTVTFTAP